MHTVAIAIDAENPWPGLGSFDETAERFFNGRRTESAELRRLVLNAPLTVLFGASGLGKTSLLQAGLFPLLRKEHQFPIYIRLDVRDTRAPLIEQLSFALRTQLDAHQVDAPAMQADESLWAYLHRPGLELWSAQNQLLTPVFVLDQFEEVFTLGADNAAAIARLRDDLADLIENRLPAPLAQAIAHDDAPSERLALDSQSYKVVVSFREDFLPSVEGWKRELPSILRNRLRLLPMSSEQAFEAVHVTASHLVDEPLAREIVRFVAAAQDDRERDAGADNAVEPALLSLVCHGLNEKRKAQHKAAFDAALLRGTGQAIIADYYEHAVGDLPERVQRFVENELITERGFRKPCDVDDARTVHGVTDAEIRRLVDRRLLRIEPQRGTDRLELTHDLLTPVVRAHRNTARERAQARRYRRRLAFITAAAVLLVALVVLFAFLFVQARRATEQAFLATAAAQLAAEDAKTQKAAADQFAQTAERARKTAEVSSKLAADQAAANRALADAAEKARGEAVQQTALANARQLATESLYKFDGSGDGLIESGALAVLSLRSEPTVEGVLALGQVLRLLPAPPEITPKAHQGIVQALALSDDGRWMATAGQDGAVVLWDLSDRQRQKRTVLDSHFRTVPSRFGLAFSPDGQWLAAGGMGELAIWNTSSGVQPQQPFHVTYVVRSVSFSPDSRRIAATQRGSGEVAFFARVADHWEEQHDANLPPSHVSGNSANGAAFLTNAVLALSGTSALGKVWFRDLAQGKDIALPSAPSGAASSVGCEWLTVSHDTHTLAALCGSDGFLIARDLIGDDLTRLTAVETRHDDVGHFSVTTAIAVSDNANLAAIDNNHDTHVFGKPLTDEIARMPLKAHALAFRPDGSALAAGLADGAVAFWPTTRTAASFPVLSQADRVLLALSADERWLATAAEDGRVRVVDIADVHHPREMQTLTLGAEPRRPTFSPDGRFLALADAEAVQVLATRSWRVLTRQPIGNEIANLAFSLDSRTLIVHTRKDIQRLDTATWTLKRPVLTGVFESLAMSPDGHNLAGFDQHSGRGHHYIASEQVWNVDTGTELAWHEDGRTDADDPASRPARSGRQALIDEARSWIPIPSKGESPNGVWRVDLSRYSSTLPLHEVSSGRTIERLEHDANLVDAAFSPRGRWLAASSADGTVRLWPLQAPDLIEMACKLLSHHPTSNEAAAARLAKACPPAKP